MIFEYRTESLRTSALSLEYFLVPWDSEILGQPVAQLADIAVTDSVRAVVDYREFERWCVQRDIALCACRLPSDRTQDTIFLEDRGFRFIELNYLPRLEALQSLSFADENVEISRALPEDRDLLVSMAGATFRHGRFHQDPRVGAALGDKRYGVWMSNAFTRPGQRVMKCSVDGSVVGFFVIESPEAGHAYWSLVGIAPGRQGSGLGKRVWRAMLRFHQNEGVRVVSTSIASQNVPIMNMYVSLGFRFPLPTVTMHWCPRGRLS